jgi:hypothetical protein
MNRGCMKWTGGSANQTAEMDVGWAFRKDPSAIEKQVFWNSQAQYRQENWETAGGEW